MQALVVQECCFGCARLMDSSQCANVNHCLLTESLHSRRRLWLGMPSVLQPLAGSAHGDGISSNWLIAELLAC